ncbi:MAG: Ger(x)C family spore germination protein [Clostridiaceae bacterium]|nr:Ger(x)C family spore germination protein [Clostridiaceae bacterium]
MNKKIISFMFIILLCVSLVGCYNYKEINKITFATSVIFDKDEYDNVVLYLDCVSPYRNASESSDKGRRIMFKGTGRSVLETIRNLNASSSNDLNFSQVRAYIFTEAAAQGGVQEYLDFIDNSQQFSFKPYMFVYFGGIQDLIEVTNGDEEYLGLYLDQLIEKNKYNGKVIMSNVNDYINNELMGDNISFMSALELKDNALEKKVELNGGVIMKNNYMLERLEEKDALYYNLLHPRKVNKGTFTVQNPDDIDSLITLDILDSKSDTDIYIDGDNITLKKDLDIKVSIGEIEGILNVDADALQKIKVLEENKIKKNEEEFFAQYQSKNIDIMGVTRLLEEKYPHYNSVDCLKNTNFVTNVNIKIDGSGLIKDSI